MIKYDNIPQIIQKLPTSGNELLDFVLQTGLHTAQLLVGVDTGALLDSIKVKKISPTHFQLSAGEGLPDARALYNNYGTYRQAATGFMSQAAIDMGNALQANGIKFRLV